MQSRAPEYSGSQELPPVAAPQALAAVAGEPAPVRSASAAVPSAPAPLVVPRLPGTPELTKEGLYSFTGGGLELTVDPQSGNVVRLALDGKDALLAPDPQPEVYSSEVEGSSLLLKSSVDGSTKRLRLDTARRSLEVSYTQTNTSKALLPVHLADVQRVNSAGGITFFPGKAGILKSTLRLNPGQPIVWFAHDQAREPKALQANFESVEGWVASVNDGLVLVKVISDENLHVVITLDSAYRAETKTRPWVDIRAENSFELLPKSTGTLSVRLFLRKLPATVAAKPGNPELVGFVRGVIQ